LPNPAWRTNFDGRTDPSFPSPDREKFMNRYRPAWFPLLLVGVVLLAPAPAFAYIDPGTGSFVIQGIIAAVVGVGFAVKMFWRRIRAFLTGKPVPTDRDDED